MMAKKVMYATESDAFNDIERIKKKRGKSYKPLTAYYCTKNECWHLTSKLKWKDKEILRLKERVSVAEKQFNDRRDELKRYRRLSHDNNVEIKALKKRVHHLESNFEQLKKHKERLREELKPLRKWRIEFLQITNNDGRENTEAYI